MRRARPSLPVPRNEPHAPRQLAGRHDAHEALDPPKLAHGSSMAASPCKLHSGSVSGACLLCGLSLEEPLMGAPGVQ